MEDDKAKFLDDLLLEVDSLSDVMRAEASVRAHASNNWTMAALITVNGGAILTLLNSEDRGWAVGIALALYVLGTVSALIAGRLSANLDQIAEHLWVVTRNLERQGRRRWLLHRARITGRSVELEDEAWRKANQDVQDARQTFDNASVPDRPLGVGIIFFFLGCVVAGFSIF